MIPQLKSKNTAYLRYLADKKNMVFSVKRIIRDMKTLEDEMKDMPYISAAPMEENLFVWYGNLLGTEENPYKGMLVHFSIALPYDYPLSPPKISILTPLKHPNVFGTQLCLAMFDIATKKVHKKWSSAYTLHSVLLQLQSFLFDVKKSFFNKRNLALIQEQVENSQDFECHASGHRGKSKPFPPFPVYKRTRESSLSVNTFQSALVYDEDEVFIEARDESGIYLDNVKCYHCKLDYKQTTIGYGVKSVKLPRTGDIKSCDPIVDHVCLRCFMKDGLYCSSTKELFNNWMPLFLEKAEWAKTLKLAEGAFSFIKTNSTKKFEPGFLIHCVPKMLVTMLYNIASRKKHPSASYIRVFVQIHGLFVKFLEKYPGLQAQMEEEIRRFVAAPENRTKGQVTSILKIPIYLLFTKKFAFQDIREAFLEEDFARRIFWVLAKIKNLDFNQEISREHMMVAFKAAVESYRIILMLVHYSRVIDANFGSMADLLAAFEAGFGKLRFKFEDAIQSGFVKALQVENYQEFFDSIGVTKTDEQICQMLKTAFNLSAERGYHGNLAKAFESKKTEFTTHSFNVSRPKTLLQVHADHGSSLDVSEGEAKRVLADTFLWIRRSLFARPGVSPEELALFSDDIDFQFNKVNHDNPDPVQVARDQLRKKWVRVEAASSAYAGLTWRDLMVKLLFERQVRSLEWEQDFPALHKALDILADHRFKGLVLYVIDISSIKMKYYYLTTILKKLHEVDHLVIRPSTDIRTTRVTLIKEIMKGFGCRSHQPSSVRFVGFQSPITYSDNSVIFVETFVKIFEKLGSSLKALEFDGCSMLNYLPKSIPHWKYIMGFCSELERLSFKNFAFSNMAGFDEGLMNLRKLTHLKIQASDSSTTNILENAIYNLNFTPTLRSLDFSNTYSRNQKLFFENISKLVKIAPNLTDLTLNNICGVKNLFTKEFAESLGGNKYLRRLSVRNAENTGAAILFLGRAVAFNRRNKGALRSLDMSGLILNASVFNSFVKGLCISNKDYELVFGNVSKAQKMENKDLTEEFTFGLETLLMDNTKSLALNEKMFESFFLHVYRQLHVLSLKYSTLDEAFCTKLNKLIKEKGTGPGSLRFLDVSNNPNLKSAHMEHLIGFLMQFPGLEFLNLRNNHLGVAFPRKFMLMAGDWLAQNKLEFLDLAFNSLKIDGMYGLSPCVARMDRLVWLDLTFNNLKDEGFRILHDELSKKGKTLDYLVFKNNFVSDAGFEKMVKNGVLGSFIKRAVFLRKNSISDSITLEHLPDLSDVAGYSFFLDLADKFFFLDRELLERTVFIPISIDARSVLRIFEKTKYEYLEDGAAGRVMSIRNRHIQSYFGKAHKDQFTFIEFATPQQAERGRMLGSKGAVIVNRKKRRVFIAGTSTFYLRKKKRNITKELITVIDNPAANVNPRRPARVARGGGRARGRPNARNARR